MSVTGTPATPNVLTTDNVRMFMRDYALGHLPGGQGNILLDSVQFTEDELNFALRMAVAAFNAMTPISTFTTVNFPNEYLLLIATARFLLVTESFHQQRNQVQAQDGDIAPSGIYEKTQGYLALSQTLQAEYQEIARNMKNQMNMEGAYSFLGSGYKNVSRHRYGP
jgi:hypothetical protein